ncbi:MAG: carboxylating nicotinate-nucleotide diphosphorylase [Myxococcota bacterium]
MKSEHLRMMVQFALEEDIREGDITTLATVGEGEKGEAQVIARQDLVLAGAEAALMVYQQLGMRFGGVSVNFRHGDGKFIRDKELIAEIEGSLRTILSGERTFLNFLCRLSGIATYTWECVREVKGTKAQILDTRKTTPGFRRLEKNAVFAGGAKNHRFGLYDMFLIKENHISAAGGITRAFRMVKDFMREQSLPRGIKIEIEVRNLKEFEIAIELAPDIIMLDNFSFDDVIKAVNIRDKKAKKVKLEVSGGLRKGKLRKVALTGVDFLSIGALTHSAPAADITMLIKKSV